MYFSCTQRQWQTTLTDQNATHCVLLIFSKMLAEPSFKTRACSACLKSITSLSVFEQCSEETYTKLLWVNEWDRNWSVQRKRGAAGKFQMQSLFLFVCLCVRKCSCDEILMLPSKLSCKVIPSLSGLPSAAPEEEERRTQLTEEMNSGFQRQAVRNDTPRFTNRQYR